MAFSSLILALAAAGAAKATNANSDRLCPMTGIQQLRIYEVFDSNKAAFHDRFRDHAKRIMDRHGFDIVAMWETRQDDRTEFVYLLQWPDEPTMKARRANFMADQQGSRIKRETGAGHGDLVGDIEDRTLRKTDYSPC